MQDAPRRTRAAALLLPLLAAFAGCGEPAPPRPHVVLVTLDTTRPDYLSCYGSPNRTPAFDAVAAEGALFQRALASSGVTPVSHATILTGRLPYEHGLRVLSAGSGFRLPEDQPTLATALRRAGYRTAAVHSAFPVSSYFGFDRDFDSFDSLDGALEVQPGATKTSWDSSRLQRRSDHTTDLCLDVLDAAQAEGRPLFLWIHYWDPHDPIVQPPPEYLSHIEAPDGAYAANSPVYEALYAAEVRFLDHEFGRLVEGLRERGMLDDTVLAVTADHGEGLADGFERHGWGKHRMNYQEQLHVPLLLRGPGVPPGRSLPDLVSTADLAPTLADLAGVPLPSASGRSLAPLLAGQALEPAVAYADQVNAFDLNASMVAMRPDAAFLYTVCDGRWKLLYRPHMPERSELFDLRDDPGETRNLLAQERDVYLRLMADLAARQPWVLEPFGAGDETVRELLGGMGYAGVEDETGPLTWTWFCPAHPDREHESFGRCDVEDCRRLLVPRTEWPPAAEGAGDGGR